MTLAFWLRAALAGIIVATVAAIARKSPAAGALVASLPLISILGMMFLWHDTQDTQRLASHAEATLWYVIPSLPMFALIPWMLRHGYGFWMALAAGCALTIGLYIITTFIAARFGITL